MKSGHMHVSHYYRDKRLLVYLCVLVLLGQVFPILRVNTKAQGAVDVENLVFVTEDWSFAPGEDSIEPGCEGITAFDSMTGRIHFQTRVSIDDPFPSPGRLAVGIGSEGVIAVSNQSNIMPAARFMRLRASGQWVDSLVENRTMAAMGGIAIDPTGTELILAEANLATSQATILRNRPPFRVGTYALSDGAPRSFGRAISRGDVDHVIAEILIASNAGVAHLILSNATLRTVSLDKLEDVAPPIMFDRMDAPQSANYPMHEDRIHADLSSDENYVVVGLGDSGSIAVLDLVTRTATTVILGSGSEYVGGVAINKGWINHGLLTVHHRDHVSVHEVQYPNRVQLLDSIPIRPATRSEEADGFGPKHAIAWSGPGNRIIAATDRGRAGEFQLLDYHPESGLGEGGIVSVCPSQYNVPNDIVTLNGLVPPPFTPTSSPSPTTTPSVSPSPTVTSSSRTPTPTASRTPTLVPSNTPVPTNTPQPMPVFLPLMLRESCQPDQRRADVLLVIDASTSMLEHTSANRSKLDAAREAARRLVSEMDLASGDQVGMVAFNEDVTLALPLSTDEFVIAQAIAGIEASPGTCIPCAVERASELLFGPAHHSVNTPALVILTDGQSNVRPVQEAVALADTAKRDGAKIFTIGLGENIEATALRVMASRPEFFYNTSDAEALGEIFESLVIEIPCPVSRFWGRR